MANSEQLSKILEKNIKNNKSKLEDLKCKRVVYKVMHNIEKNLCVKLDWKTNIYLKDIVAKLEIMDKDTKFDEVRPKSNIRPDGGLLYLLDKDKNKYMILITEMKSQGTNYKKEKKQSMGNAVERLGKNVIALRTFLHNEGIFPFVCFGDGCDFYKESTILDRVRAIAKFGILNINGEDEVNNYYKNRGSYYFREKDWSEQFMYKVMYDIAERSIFYYFCKYGKKNFITK